MAVKLTTEINSATDGVRTAFARGISSESAAVLLEAREHGLDWEEATRAVADGLAERYGTSQSQGPKVNQPRDSTLKMVVSALVAYERSSPRDSGVWSRAGGCRFGVDNSRRGGDRHVGAGHPIPGTDPIYTGAATRAAGGVDSPNFRWVWRVRS